MPMLNNYEGEFKMLKMKKTALAFASAALLSGNAIATPVIEVEANDSFATGQLVGGHDGTVQISGDRFGNASADHYRINATAGDVVSFFAGAVGGGVCFTRDTVIGLFDPSGASRAVDDDSGGSCNSFLTFAIDSTGLWDFAISGFADFAFTGGGNADWAYTADIRGLTAVPEPTSIALLGLGLAGFAFGRRQKRSA